MGKRARTHARTHTHTHTHTWTWQRVRGRQADRQTDRQKKKPWRETQDKTEAAALLDRLKISGPIDQQQRYGRELGLMAKTLLQDLRLKRGDELGDGRDFVVGR